jgi:tripartite ATP-independent transporter DctP family solute receptor
MTKFTRRLFLGGAAGTIGMPLVARYAHAAEFTLKVGSDVPPDYPVNIRLAEAGERVKARTGGRVEMSVFPNSQLGQDMVDQVRNGSLEFFACSGSLIVSLVPICGLTALGFAFKDADTAHSATDGDVGALIRQQMEKVGLYTMPYIMEGGFRQIISASKVIKTPDDLRGFKIRVPLAPMSVSLFSKLGASPTPINVAELYTALQTKIVDGAENYLSLLYAYKFYEVQKNISMTSHSWDGYWMIANPTMWRGLPQNFQQILQEELKQSTLDQRKDTVVVEANARKNMIDKGMSITDPDLDSFHNKLKTSGYYSEWREKFGPEAWRALEKYAGPLG